MRQFVIGHAVVASIGAAALLAAATAVTNATAFQQPAASAGRWITAWGVAPNGVGMDALTNATVRLIAQVTVSGDSVRIRLDNTFGKAPLAIGKAYVGQRIQAANLAEGSNRAVMFGGAATVDIPVGGNVVSDPVQMKVLAGQDLAVSLYVPGSDVQASQHGGAQVTSYVSANGSGDVSANESRMPFTKTITSMPWLKAIDVLSSTSTGTIVAFGDSITDGTCSTLDAHNRWEDWLEVRLALDDYAHGNNRAHKGMVNAGIGGNTIAREAYTPPPDGPAGLDRLDRDVLSNQGVTHVIFFMGTNDIRRGATTAQLMEWMQDIAKRVKAKGIKVIGVTIIPRHVNPRPATDPRGGGWSLANNQVRSEINQWIRTKAPFDGVIDFDKVVADPANPDLLSPSFNCGDGTHPTPLGYFEMAKSVRLDLFK